MALIRPYTWTIIFLLPIAAALLNTGLFGSQSLTAYFGYTILAPFTALITGLALLKDKRSVALPPSVLLFFALALFIFLHGSITGTLNLTHYLWAASAVYLWAAAQTRTAQTRPQNPTQTPSQTPASVFNAIAVIALLESLVVCSQWLQLLPSKNSLYTCTGTWENPNVTAMFLSMAFYAALQGISYESTSGRVPLKGIISNNRRIVNFVIAALILLAICLLRCRTAVIVAALFLTGHYWTSLVAWFNTRAKLNKRVLVSLAVIVFAGGAALLAFGVKRASTRGRIGIWENSLQLIAQRPLAGQGIGYFEKQYNLFTADKELPGNDHVNMAYNDFLELGVEGGLGTVILWLAFLIVLWRQRQKNDRSVLPILALLIIQLTNFGFQALPVFALFLVYAGMPTEIMQPATSNTSPAAASASQPAYLRIVSLSAVLLIAFALLFHQSALAKSFYDCNRIGIDDPPEEALAGYAALAPSLDGFVSYHQHFGDSFMKLGRYRSARTQYLQGLQTSSNPDLMIKCGYCFQQLHQFDSSSYYYTLAENIEPYKFSPRLALLKLYQQSGDSPAAKKEAQEIVNMPVKIESDQVNKIKNYAWQILEKDKQ